MFERSICVQCSNMVDAQICHPRASFKNSKNIPIMYPADKQGWGNCNLEL